MRHPVCANAVRMCLLLCAPALLCGAEPGSRTLPQAMPGTSYAAQLSIPPGLGYPFAHCELVGEAPRWLAVDCARLVLKGRVPAPSSADREYRVTLRIEDHAGASLSFPLTLRVSSKPQVVDLAAPLPGSATVAAAKETPAHGSLPSARAENRAENEEASSAPSSSASVAHEAPVVPALTDASVSDHPAVYNTPVTEGGAAELGAAAAQLLNANLSSPMRTSPRRSSAASIRVKPPGVHGVVADEAKCSNTLPDATDPTTPNDEDKDSITALKKVKGNCDGKHKSACTVDLKDSGDFRTKVKKSIAALNFCAQAGVYDKAGKETALSAKTQDWYRDRAGLWQDLADDITAQASAAGDGSYTFAEGLAKNLEDPAFAPAPGPNTLRVVGTVESGASSINVQAPSSMALSLYSLQNSLDSPPSASSICSRTEIDDAYLVPLKKSATDATVATSIEPKEAGVQTLYLQEAVSAGTRLCLAATLVDKDNKPTGDPEKYSNIATVEDSLTWGRVRAYFVGGVLISNTSDSFSSSSANQFLDLNVDRFWRIPDCAASVAANGMCPTRFFHRVPGFSTYFDTRLTAIPVSSKTSTTTTPPASGTSASAIDHANDATTTPATTTLTTQKTARVQVGAYWPFLLSTWTYRKSGNALYVAPLAKAGFDTLTGSTNPSTSSPSATAGSTTTVQQDLNRVYNFYSFGGRVGHFGLYPTSSKSPELLSYLDVNFGPYSNLPSYICEQSRPWAAVQSTDGSACGSGPLAGLTYASEKRVWRLDLEGLLQIPSTPIVIGFNANIGQKSVGAKNIDTKRIPDDDVRFLFGTKFDVASVLKKLGVNQ